jgi:endo-1,4-beta-mannosidase
VPPDPEPQTLHAGKDGLFRLGVNYWPAEHAMDWLAVYDPEATRRDFARARAAGFDSLRVFVRWSDVQPAEATIDTAVLGRLIDAADAAWEVGAQLIVTLFVGHMSGVNWAPEWAAGGADGDPRFRVVVAGPGAASERRLRNWYSDPGIGTAQERLAVSVASALRGHPAVWMWDLGNENSNCTIPPDARAGSAWLERMSGAIRASDPGRPITVGLHMEDLEDDRRIGPAEVARYCDVVSMHGYPAYTAWAYGPDDERLLPFLALLTRWLAGGTAVLFEEFGLPTGTPAGTGPDRLVGEDAAAAYTGRGLDGLRRVGCLGALVWCFADYVPALHRRPPFDEARHERSFGLWRSDGSPKPAVVEITRRAGRLRRPPPEELSWLDLDVGEFLADRTRHLPRLYRRYCQAELS